jgi:hypothetical protein
LNEKRGTILAFINFVKNRHMKRIIIIATSFILLTVAFTSCEVLGTCKICREITFQTNRGIINEGPEAEYCDAELIAKETQDDLVIGDKRYYWECR